ncbi:fmn1 [Pungitius sinensis]
MAPVMEGTHTVVLLYAPVTERSNISLYFPKRRPPGFKYKSRAPHSEIACNDHDRAKENPAVSEQRGQSPGSSSRLLIARQATKDAVAELCWLAAEHHQLLADLLSLCRDCAVKVRMGNQDGKLQDYMEGTEVHPGGQIRDVAGAPDPKRAASKSKKPKKSGGKKLDGVEDVPHSKARMKRKVGRGTPSVGPPASVLPVSVTQQVPATSASGHVTDSPVTGSYVSAASNPILPTEEPFQIPREVWDFVEDNRAFDPDVDFCTDFSEYDGELGYESSFCNLMEGLTRRESGNNLRPVKKADPMGGVAFESGEINQIDEGVRVVAKVQDVEGRLQHVNHARPEGAGQAVLPPGTSSCQQGSGQWRGPNVEPLLGVNGEKTSNQLSVGLRFPLSHSSEPRPPGKSHAKSPSSTSLAGVFNTSFPASNSLHSMSPVLSPLSPKQASPQLNHRVVLLSDNDVATERDGPGNAGEAKVSSDAVDNSGNKRPVARLELNLSRRPSNFKGNSSSNSTTTEDPFLRHDDIWMLDGDDHPEPISRGPRPDHLDFLRITPPEDDILGDTPYCPKLECTVRAPKLRKRLQFQM